MKLKQKLGKTINRLLLSTCIIGAAINVSYVNKSFSAPISIEDLAKFESITNVTVSPDGKHISALVGAPNQKWPVISIWDGEDLTKAPIWIPSATNRIIQVGFLSNDKISFITEQPITRGDGRLTYTYKLYVAGIDGKNIIEPFHKTGTKNKEIREQMEKGISVGIFNSNLYNEDELLISTTNPENFSTEIYRFNTKTGETNMVAREGEQWEFDSSGVDLTTGIPMIRRKFEVKSDGEYYAIVQVRDAKTNTWVEHPPLGFKAKERISINIIGFDEDPNHLLVQTTRGNNNKGIYVYDLTTKEFDKEPLYANDKFDVTNIDIKYDYAAKKIAEIRGITVNGSAPVQIMFEPKWSELMQKFKNTFPGTNVYIDVAKRDENSAIAIVDSPSLPTEYYFYHNGKITKLGSKRPWIDPKTLGKSEWITYKARDGLEIPAILSLPPGYDKSKGPIPLIVHPHGGPWARDEMTWDDSGWVPFLTTRGLAVLQPQYRGSEDLGDKLWKAGDFEWGQKMQDDKDDGAAYLVAQGIADPKKMAIFGYSYGGFAAIAASVRPNSPYKCAIGGAGVSSLDRIGNLWGSSPFSNDVQGRTVKGMDPIKNVAKANIPIMLYHGDRDRQADTDHSRIFYKAMKAAGKDIEYTEIKDMHHTMPWRPEWQRQSLALIENYLKSDKCGILSKQFKIVQICTKLMRLIACFGMLSKQAFSFLCVSNDTVAMNFALNVLQQCCQKLTIV